MNAKSVFIENKNTNRSIALTVVCACLLMACEATVDNAGDTTEGTAKQDIRQGYSETASQYEVDGFIVSNSNVEAKLWNPRGKTDEQITHRARFLADAVETRI